MRITHYLYNSFLIEEGGTRVAIDPEVVIPCHYYVPFLWKREIAVAADQAFKRGVKGLGKKCCVLGAGGVLAV